MVETLTIAKPLAPRPSQDYDFLRAEGIRYIERLGHRLWNDYNVHDPGITILEMLCYAITDLDFRTSYDIRDLLALRPDGTSKFHPGPGNGPKYFHTARDILTVNPVTVNDYRKLIIDVEGVRNAWLLPSGQAEIPFYVDLSEGELTYENTTDGDQNPEVELSGLYNILVEFEEDDEYGDLNDPVIEWTLPLLDGDQAVKFIFPHWAELLTGEYGDPGCLGANTNTSVERAERFVRYGTISKLEVKGPDNPCFDGDVRGYRTRVSIEFDYVIPGKPLDPGFSCGQDINPESVAPDQIQFAADTVGSDTLDLDLLVQTTIPLAELETELLELLQDNANERLIEFYRAKIANTLDIVDRVRCRLMNHRNLCEDYQKIESLKSEEIAICADIEVGPRADIDEVLAEAYFQLGNFISPPINFYTLEEMFDKGYRSDAVFNGPILEHGFIENKELNAAILRRELRTSDLINILMDIPGIVAVRDLIVANYVDGQPLTTGEKWELPLKGDGLHVPKLSPEKSKMLFFRDVLPYRANEERVNELLREKLARNRKMRLKGIDLDIPVPEGTDPEVGAYQTIQNDFPLVYGIGEEGIPGSPDATRIAKARQLKAYLLFFDQILANYCAQLGNIGDLFSMDPGTGTQTYFVQAITDLRESEQLHIDYDNVNKYDPVEDYLASIAESSELQLERKNRFLDHLLGRFAESFSEYGLLMYNLENQVAPSELVTDKLAFLQDYPAVSRDRGKAFNYRPRLADCLTCDPYAIWNTKDNVSGFKKRVSRLLGIDEYHRRNLTCNCFGVEEIKYSGEPSGWVWYLKDPNHKVGDPFDVLTHTGILLRSVEYDSEESARFMITYAIAMIEDGHTMMAAKKGLDGFDCCEKVGVKDSNSVVKTQGYRFTVNNPCESPIACSPDYATEKEMRDNYARAIEYVLKYCTVEGMHIIEHILLRPRYKEDITDPNKHDHLLPVCLDHLDPTMSDSAIQATNDVTQLFFDVYVDGKEQWQFVGKDQNGVQVLTSQTDEVRDNASSLRKTRENMQKLTKARENPANYAYQRTATGKYFYQVLDDDGKVLAESRAFESLADQIVDMNALQCLNATDDSGPTGPPARPYCYEDADPYTFRMSVILPSWAGRFRDINYRQLVEKTLRLEAPAHISLRICWIDRDQMADFDCAYLEWLKAVGNCDAAPESISPKLNDLIEVMYNLRNVYPTATLHDCDDSIPGTAPVVLNYTSLGTI